MTPRRDELLDAAITVIGERGIRALTHRAVDVAAGLPPGSASNYFRTRDALLNAVVGRFAERERANWEGIAARICPRTPRELAAALTEFARDATGPNRAVTMARYALLLEAGLHPALRDHLRATGSRVNSWFSNWLMIAGSADPGRDSPIVMNCWTGLVLHELAMPDPGFDPSAQLADLVTAVIGRSPVRAGAS